ncbi:MAG TPA: enoyl-CoA hydratase/isomerase family protein [Acidimicrobiales bacterium]|nr:enoyl-CoA hydratase/isomerase family protein [Acidimicrobiales bacterium]
MPYSGYADFEHLSCERTRDGVVIVTLDRPEVLNAANVAMHREMSEIWAVIDSDEQAHASVVTGAGRAFSAGGDLDMIEQMTEDYDAVLVQWRDAGAIVERMLDSRKPVVSAINGVAVGAGLAVALLADVSIVGRSARLSDGHARLGVAAGDHAAILWPLLCGMAKAKYYLMTADFVDGEEAERIGLVTKCVDDDRVLSEAVSIAERLARSSATAVQWTKRVMNQWLRQAMPAFGESVALEMLGFLGPDAREGLAAIRERRDPVFPSVVPPSPGGSTAR